MTNQEAVNVLFNEWKCIDRNDGIHCDRKCESCDLVMDVGIIREAYNMAISALQAQPEPLTDKEQRIFLAAMGREEKICEEVDRNYVREPYEDSLVRVCKEIRRKVKGALWI